VLTRYFVILLAFVLAIIRLQDRAWVDGTGLLSLAIGLSCLRLADLKQMPILKKVAWVCFGVTIAAMGIVLQRDYLR
jgi:hypothetical protein